MGRDYETELFDLLKQAAPDDPGAANAPEETVAGYEEQASVEKATPKPISVRNLFVHHDTHPLVLGVKLLDQYGTDWYEWEPETIWREIMDDFRTPSISDHTKSKIQAVKSIQISDLCFQKWEIFCVITQALNNNIPDFEIMRKPTVSQLFVAVDIMTMIRNDVPFGDQLQQWLAASLLTDGVIYAPDPIAFCQDEILDFMKDSGREVDPQPIREKYKTVMLTPSDQVVLEENAVDIQVAKLLVARDYMQLRRDQMKSQMQVLR